MYLLVFAFACALVFKAAILYLGSNRKDWKAKIRQSRAPLAANNLSVVHHVAHRTDQKKVVVVGASSFLAR